MDIKLIIGLGNPGSEYEKTRHNAGFWFLDDFFSTNFKLNKDFNALLAEYVINGNKVWLLKPMTFMNKSGYSVQKFINFYKLTPEQILVVHDELDFLPGTVKLKIGGGHGGHNGLRDIATQLSSKNFLRLRIGIGHPGDSSQVANYVLKSPNKDDKSKIDEAMTRGAHALDILIKENLDKAMLALHTK